MAMSADLDKAIDRAVREMLDVEPPADLRAEVIARIHERPASRFRLQASRVPRFGVLRFGAVVAAAAALVLIVVLVRRGDAPARESAIVRAENAPRTSPTANAQPGERAPSPTLSVTRVARPRLSRPAAAVVAAASLGAPDSPTGDVDPLKRITPIALAPIAQTSITPEPIAVTPLNPIPEMQIAPLNPPDGRN